MKRFKWISLALLLFLSVALLGGCGAPKNESKAPEKQEQTNAETENKSEIPKESEASPKEEKKAEPAKEAESKILRIAGRGDAGSLTPYKHMNRGPGIFKMHFIYDSLLERGPEGDIPWLAKSYESNEDKTAFTFQLQENVKWHDGKPFSADDVVFTFNYYEVHPPLRNYLVDKGQSFIKEVKKIDEHTVFIQLTGYSPTYLTRVGSARIIPKHIWEKVEEPLKFEGDGAHVGCGPYMLKEYIPEQGAYQFEAFKDYWGPKQVADIIEYIPVSEPVLALENGEIDISAVTPETLDRFEGKEGFEVKKYHTQHSYRLYFNGEKRSELKEKAIRQAFAYAINREDIMEKALRGYGEITPMGYLIQGHPYYNPNIPAYSFDREKALSLLKDQSLSFDLLVSNRPKEVKIAELIKLDLEKVNIQVNIRSIDYKSRDKAVQDKDYELALIYYGGMGADPNMLRDIFYSAQGKKGGKIPGYSNPELDKVLDAQAVERDLEKRKAYVFKAQEMIAEDVPMLLLFGDIELCVFRPEKNNSWTGVYDHSRIYHPKLSFLETK